MEQAHDLVDGTFCNVIEISRLPWAISTCSFSNVRDIDNDARRI
jgi:hypothetical protein